MMHKEEYEELVQTVAEQISADLFDLNYYDLSPDLRVWVRVHAIESLWPEEVATFSIAAA